MTPNAHHSGIRFNQPIVWGLVVFTVIYRIIASQIPELSNSSPTMALCFGGGLLLGRKFWWVPALLILLSDFLIGLKNSGEGIGLYTLMTVTFFCGVAWMASWIGDGRNSFSKRSWLTLWGGVLTSSLLFYLAANTFAFVTEAGYQKSFAGWWQCQTMGLPGYAPSWVFLKNALIGDSLWCVFAGLLFFVQVRLNDKRQVASN